MRLADHCVQVCFCFTAQSNRVLSFLLSGCVFRGHIYSSRLLRGKPVCGQATDAFVLRLHDVSGSLLKIICHVLSLTNCELED